ncbi:MAG: hypothetical protein R6V54_14845 [Desulfobacteraceae bacterium]
MCGFILINTRLSPERGEGTVKEDDMEVNNGQNAFLALHRSNGKVQTGQPSGGNALHQGISSGNKNRVFLGRISDKVPTVSELICQTPLKNQCWKIVFNDVNGDKPFRKIQPGTEIFMDTRTNELFWGETAQTSGLAEKSRPMAEPPVLNRYPVKGGPALDPQIDPAGEAGKGPRVGSSEKEDAGLANAVSRFIGNDYEEMDCYEMVVNGLKRMGVKYQGRGGLGEHLIQDALSRGLGYNHFLNGEGLVSRSGNKVFEKSFFSVNDPHAASRQVMQEMDTRLEPGQILSFSTRTRGHTGVVSKKDGVWTFINSGTMDNDLAGRNGLKGVGEEALNEEVANWFTLASRLGQGLKITLGSMDMEKLAKFRGENGKEDGQV